MADMNEREVVMQACITHIGSEKLTRIRSFKVSKVSGVRRCYASFPRTHLAEN